MFDEVSLSLKRSFLFFYAQSTLFSKVLIVCIVISCQNNDDKLDKLPTNWMDSLKSKHPNFAWLTNSANLQDSTYTKRLYVTYNQLLQNNKLDTALFYLIGAGDVLDRHYHFDSTFLKLAKQHIKLYEAKQLEKGELVKLYHQIGSQLTTNEQFDLAKQWYYKGLNHPHVLEKTKVKCRTDLSFIYGYENKIDSSVKLVAQNLAYYEQIGDTKHIGIANNNLAINYRELKAYRLAENHFNLALLNTEIQKDTFVYFQILNYHNSFLYETNATNDSISKSLYLMEQIAGKKAYESPVVGYYLNEKKLRYDLFNNQLNKAPALLDSLKKYSLLRNNRISSAYYYANYRYQLLSGASELNLPKIDSVLIDLIEADDLYHAESFAKELHAFYKKKQNFNKSLSYHEMAAKIDSQLYASNSKGQLYELSIKYETDKKEQALKLQNVELKNKQQNIYLLISLLVIVVFLVCIYIIWQKQIQLKQKQLAESQFSQQLMENTEIERQRIAKELHDSVGHQLLDIKNSILNEIKLQEFKVDEVIQNVRDISRNLFPVMFEQLRLKRSIENLIESINITEKFYIDLEINYPENSLSINKELHLYRIIQEAISNIRKHSKAESAKIELFENKSQLILVIKDNGIGFKMDKLNENSFGLMGMKQRAKSIGAKFQIESNENGTIININIPLDNV